MPTYDEKQKQYYSTYKEVLDKFRNEQKRKCFCKMDKWAGNLNKITCLNCIRKERLEDELKNKAFWTRFKDLKYWKVRRQGQYKKLKIAPVYPKIDWERAINN